MDEMKTTGKLDCDIKLLCKRIYSFIGNPICEGSSFTIVGEDQDLVAYGSEEPACQKVGVLGWLFREICVDFRAFEAGRGGAGRGPRPGQAAARHKNRGVSGMRGMKGDLYRPAA